MPDKEAIGTIRITENHLPPHLRNRKKNNSSYYEQVSDSGSNIICGENIISHEPISVGSDCKAYHCSIANTVKPAFAFSKSAGKVDELVYYQTSGKMTITNAGFQPGGTVWLAGAAPYVTTDIPPEVQGNIRQRLGRAMTEDVMEIAIERAVRIG